MKKYKINFVVFIFSIIFLLLITTSNNILSNINNYEAKLKAQIEQQKREDARLLLADVIQRFDIAVKNNQVNPNDIKSVEKWATINFAGLRNGGATSDGFVIELGSEQFIVDLSEDCRGEEYVNGRFLKDEVSKHKETKLTEDVINKMKLGIPTQYGDNYYGNSNGYTEWLEWVVYPTNISLGLNNEPKTNVGIKNIKYKKYIFVLGTQSDEILVHYRYQFDRLHDITKHIYIILFIVLFLIISVSFYIVYAEYHHHKNIKRKRGD